jgi:hypothetical protein
MKDSFHTLDMSKYEFIDNNFFTLTLTLGKYMQQKNITTDIEEIKKKYIILYFQKA